MGVTSTHRDLSRLPLLLLPHTSGEEPSPTMDGSGQGSNVALEVQDPAVGSDGEEKCSATAA